MIFDRRRAFITRWAPILLLATHGLDVEGRSSPCPGTYVNDLSRLTASARQLESGTRYTFCLRSTAVYDCLYFGNAGKVRHRKETATTHGTAFAFRQERGQTYLLTNEHVVEWPFVTTAEQNVEGVPPGCKRTSQTVTIVDNEQDSYAKDDLTLQRVVTDVELDVAVLRGPLPASRIPFTLGQSSALRTGNAVHVRGFPLGAFQAVSLGKVINPREHDTEERWDHYDFVVDAQLSGGNSGSPVLAVNCRTGGFELLGIFHAAYREGQSLNVVVGIDDFRELMTTLKPRRRSPARLALAASDRTRLVQGLRDGSVTPLIPFGGHTVGIRLTRDRLLYDIYSRSFPLLDWRLAVIEDLPAPGFGRFGRLWFGNEQGLREHTFSALTPDDQLRISNLVRAMHQHLFQVLLYRRLQLDERRDRTVHDQLRALQRRMNRSDDEHKLLLRTTLEQLARLAPAAGERGLDAAVTARRPGPAVVPVVAPPGPRKAPPGPQKPPPGAPTPKSKPPAPKQ